VIYGRRVAETNKELEARILANPDDRDAYAVYGDWLSERNDPRGELIAVQMKLEGAPGDTALREREKKLLDANREAWLGESLAKLTKEDDFHVTWRWGFVDGVRIGPVEGYETSSIDFPDTIASLAEVPHYNLVRDITIGAFEYDDYPTSWNNSIEALNEAGVPQNLRKLAFSRGGFWDISSTELGDLSPLYPQLKNLRELSIEMGAMQLGKIELPALQKLEIITGGLTSDNVRSITDAKWPALETLSLCIGESGNDYGCTVQSEDLEPIFVAENIPHVKHLALANSSLADQIAASLVKSRILPRLQSLDLSKGMMTDDGARAILDNWNAFSHLAKIDLSHGYFTEGVVGELKAKGDKIVLGDLQRADEDYRYCEISE